MDYKDLDMTIDKFFKDLVSNATIYYDQVDKDGNHIMVTNKPIDLKDNTILKEAPSEITSLCKEVDAATNKITALEKQLEIANSHVKQYEAQEKNRLEQINQSKIRYKNLCETFGEQICDLYCSWLDLVEELKFEKEPFVKDINDSLDTIVDDMKESYN